MRRKKVHIALIVFVVLCMAGCVSIYLYDVLCRNTPAAENLFRMLAVFFMLSATLVRLAAGGGRKSLDIYERSYSNEIGCAFQNKPFQRKKLLCACRLYDESNYRKALKYLFQLLPSCEIERDSVPVLLFIALCYTDVGCTEDAIRVYYELLQEAPDHAQAHSNLGSALMQAGDFETALKHYNKSLEINPNNYSAYVNRANYYFRIEKYDDAISDAEQALKVKNNGSEAAALLTIVYALREDDENMKKYYHLSISSGKRPEEMDRALQYYLSENDI